ncbi:hypothetical protein M5E87_10255 [Flavonifractor plautii]|nr:hypothetical protein M5E87_10255 [Flavonifractor plautii]
MLLSLPSVLGCTLLLTSAAPTVVQGRTRSFRCGCAAAPACPAPASGPSPLEQPAHRRGRAGAVGARAHRTGRSAHSGAGHPHCGKLICRAERAWTCDLLGLFPCPSPPGGRRRC